jgi:hypothetical protein
MTHSVFLLRQNQLLKYALGIRTQHQSPCVNQRGLSLQVRFTKRRALACLTTTTMVKNTQHIIQNEMQSTADNKNHPAVDTPKNIFYGNSRRILMSLLPVENNSAANIMFTVTKTPWFLSKPTVKGAIVNHLY